jgi:hypothetical protein
LVVPQLLYSLHYFVFRRISDWLTTRKWWMQTACVLWLSASTLVWPA